jgi:hypothetical protein
MPKMKPKMANDSMIKPPSNEQQCPQLTTGRKEKPVAIRGLHERSGRSMKVDHSGQTTNLTDCDDGCKTLATGGSGPVLIFGMIEEINGEINGTGIGTGLIS